MTIQTREEAARRALAKKTNVPGSCQMTTRDYYDAPSAGDQDHDNDADAIDGWLSEPTWAKHVGEPGPLGVPAYFRNTDGTGHGHRAIFVEGHLIRSTDYNGQTKQWQEGVMGTGTVADIERAMSLTYVGWSETITGFPIPKEELVTPPPPPEPPKPEPEDPRPGTDLAEARSLLVRARRRANEKGFTARVKALTTIIRSLSDVPEGR